MGRRRPFDHKTINAEVVAKNSCQARVVLNNKNASVHTSRSARNGQRSDGADVECAVEVKSSAVILRNAARDCETQATAVPVRRAAARKPLLHTAQVLGGNTFSVISNRELNLTA